MDAFHKDPGPVSPCAVRHDCKLEIIAVQIRAGKGLLVGRDIHYDSRTVLTVQGRCEQ